MNRDVDSIARAIREKHEREGLIPPPPPAPPAPEAPKTSKGKRKRGK